MTFNSHLGHGQYLIDRYPRHELGRQNLRIRIDEGIPQACATEGREGNGLENTQHITVDTSLSSLSLCYAKETFKYPFPFEAPIPEYKSTRAREQHSTPLSAFHTYRKNECA